MSLKPAVKLHRITELTVEMLKENGITALILDVDNTLSTHHGMKPVDGLFDWLNMMRTAGVGLVIVSNSKKARVEPFADALSLPFVSMGLKPMSFGFRKSMKTLCVQKGKVAAVGDQFFTDLLGAKFFGIKMILLDPIQLEKQFHFRFKRFLERIIYIIFRIR